MQTMQEHRQSAHVRRVGFDSLFRFRLRLESQRRTLNRRIHVRRAHFGKYLGDVFCVLRALLTAPIHLFLDGCWCMYWRLGAAYRKRPREKNKAAFKRIVKNGPPLGLLAFDGDVAVGWRQLKPRSALPWLDHEWRLKRVDEVAVWAISCSYVRIGYRKRGVTSALIAAAIKTAKRAKAPQLEAYPLDAAKTPSASGTGQWRRG
jgi:GNAT superfamily N-acetyltransferase